MALIAAGLSLLVLVLVLVLMNFSVKATLPAWTLKRYPLSTQPIRLPLKRSSNGGMARRFSALCPCARIDSVSVATCSADRGAWPLCFASEGVALDALVWSSDSPNTAGAEILADRRRASPTLPGLALQAVCNQPPGFAGSRVRRQPVNQQQGPAVLDSQSIERGSLQVFDGQARVRQRRLPASYAVGGIVTLTGVLKRLPIFIRG